MNLDFLGLLGSMHFTGGFFLDALSKYFIIFFMVDYPKLLFQLYENMKQDDIETLADINDKKELEELARDFGNDDKQIKQTKLK